MGHEKAQETCRNGMGPSKQLEICIQKSTVRIIHDTYVLNEYDGRLWWNYHCQYHTLYSSRCGKVEGDTKKYKIFTIVNPLGSSKLPSYLQRWDPKSFTIEQVIEVNALNTFIVKMRKRSLACNSVDIILIYYRQYRCQKEA